MYWDHSWGMGWMMLWGSILWLLIIAAVIWAAFKRTSAGVRVDDGVTELSAPSKRSG